MNDALADKNKLRIEPVKMLLFFLVFVIIVFFVIFVFIVPSVKSYKKIKTEHARFALMTRSMEEVISKKEEELHTLVKDNSQALDALIARFDRNDFVAYANKFFKKVKLSKMQNNKIKDGYTLYELNVTSSIHTPSNFYNFLDGLVRYKSVVKIDYPITMQADKEMIKARFKVQVYRTDDAD